MFGFTLVLLAGCGTTQPSKFYILSPVPAGASAAARDNEPTVGLGPVVIPKYLDRPQIVRRAGDNQLLLAESHRWAEPLANNFIRVLAEDLSVVIPTEQVAVYPWSRTTRIDYQVSVDVMRFDADANGNAVLSTDWKVQETESEKIIVSKRSTFSEAALAADYAAIVAAQSRLLAAFAGEIAGVIRSAASVSN
jgi:uncharacterized lipoprotein YmbA